MQNILLFKNQNKTAFFKLFYHNVNYNYVKNSLNKADFNG